MTLPTAADYAAATDLILYVATHPVLDAANIARIIASHRTLPAPGLLTALGRWDDGAVLLYREAMDEPV